MAEGSNPLNRLDCRAGLSCPPEGVPEEPPDEAREYELSEAVIGADYKISYGSTLYADVSIAGTSNTNGKSTIVGLRAPLIPPYKNFQLYYGNGLTSVGIEIPNLMPRIGLGNISVGPSGLNLGWFSVTSAPDPWLILAGGVIILLQTIVEGCDSGSDCVLKYGSRLVNAATPINTLRELMQMMGIDTAEEACGAIWEQNSYDRCLLYSASYMSQGLFTVAQDMVKGGLKDMMLDPYVRATLMEERDRIRFAKSKGGITYGTSLEIARNMKTAAAETKAFLSKHEGWIFGNEADDPSDDPSYDEMHSFLGNSLYLLRKLQTSAVVEGKKIKITGGTPVAFEKAGDMVEFMQTAAAVYEAFSKSDTLWDLMTDQTARDAKDLTLDSGQLSPELIIARWFRYKNTTGLMKELASPYLHTLFGLRKVHLMARARGASKGGEGKKVAEKLARIKLPALGLMEERRGLAMMRQAEAIEAAQFLVEAPMIYQGLETMLRLSHKRDQQAEVRGLDFTGIDDTPPYRTAFLSLYDMEALGRKSDTPLYLRSIRRKAGTLLDRVVSKHRKRIDSEIASYEGTMKKALKKLFKATDGVAELIGDKAARKALMVELKKFREDMEEACLSDEVVASPDVEALIATNDLMSRWFEKASLAMWDALRAEEKRLAAKGEEAKLKEWGAKAEEEAAAAAGAFHDAQSLRKSTAMMKIFLSVE
ncbi:MAG TPA: hypothetical protein PLY45_02095 [bacterium]|nr:hypothetical protein [bacterium]